MLGILVYLHYQIAIRSFALIHEVRKMVSNILHVEDGQRGEADNDRHVYAAIGNFTTSAGAKLGAIGARPRQANTNNGGKGSDAKAETTDAGVPDDGKGKNLAVSEKNFDAANERGSILPTDPQQSGGEPPAGGGEPPAGGGSAAGDNPPKS
ncbi:hypothetical protein [Muricoccus pecuniae]|uniref:Uncharacterized protein n=1 Tax=Muricoccus pecuniae TaxID=693023 RepID=A0A840YBY0_9PROT|nr:hypothetical protein [Roseomonas pecuniae]MBB5693581.1 hypothetical protein [Roseomonas pecuniae]